MLSGPVRKFTACCGATASSSARVGKRDSFSRVMNTCCSEIHPPAGTTRVRAAM